MNRIVKSRSWATQRLANYFPPWSRARMDEFSITQQLLHPIGNSLEEVFTQLARASRNNFVESSDINQICISDYFILPRGFPITRDNTDEVNLRYREPSCSGSYLNFEGDAVSVDILALDLNSAEGFFTADPTGLEIIGAPETRLVVLSTTALEDLGTAVFNEPPNATYLWITVAGVTDFRSIIGTSFVRGYIKLTGLSSKGIEEEEVIEVAWNKTIRTKVRWASLTQVETVSLYPSTATLTIEADSFFISRHLDEMNLFVDDIAERQIYYSVQATDDDRTELLHESYSALNLGDLEDGHADFDVVKTIELRSQANEDLTIANIVYDPWSETIYGTNGVNLYYWDVLPLYPSIRSELFSTPGLSNRIYTEEGRFIGLGDDMEFTCRRGRDDKQLNAIRWTVYMPDGTKYYLSMFDDMEAWTDPKAGWIYTGNIAQDLWKLKFHPVFSQRGVTHVVLETMYAEQLYEKDVYPVIVDSLTARGAIELPEDLVGSTRLSIDANGTLWFYNAGTITPTKLRHDVFLMDYARRVAYFRERYIEVTMVPGA